MASLNKTALLPSIVNRGSRERRHVLLLLALIAAFITTLAVAGDSRSATIAAGGTQGCSIAKGGAVCWGSPSQGALGNGALSGAYTSLPRPVVGLSSGVTDIVARGGSGSSACAIQNGAAKCWGNNTGGRLGNGTKTASATPVQVLGHEHGVSDISLGGAHSCAVSNGSAKCWGSNGGLRGRLGDGTGKDSLTPVQPVGLESGVSAIAAGWRHTCAIQGGAVKCSGDNTNGELGYDRNSICNQPGHDGRCGSYNNSHRYTPRPVIGLPGPATHLTAGTDFNCAIIAGGAVYCWGANSSGQLGDGTKVSRSAPRQVSGLASGVLDISGDDRHACAILANRTLVCWGSNQNGQIGGGGPLAHNPPALTPVAVKNLRGVTSVATGASHTCATASGVQWCWGRNNLKQLGSAAGDSSVPVRVGPKPAPAKITWPGAAQRVNAARLAVVATIHCPAPAACAVVKPRTVSLRIAGKSYSASILGPASVRAGKKANLSVKLNVAAANALAGRTALVRFNVTATTQGLKATKTVRTTIKR